MKPIILLLILCILPTTFATVVSNFSNSVIPGENLADPGAIFYDGHYYVANTGGHGGGKLPMHRSVDLQTWEYVGVIFPQDQLPKWAEKHGDFWAPEIHIINGEFRVVYAAQDSNGLQCIGIGSSKNIEGPYIDMGAPLIKNTTIGSIDPTVLSLKNGTNYLLWKDAGNSHHPRLPTWIKAQLMGNDGLSVTGPVYYLLRNTLPWEAHVTEAPWVVHRDGYFYLFYSGHDYCDKTYAVGVARSKDPLGPYEKKGPPILHSNTEWVGPGHCSVLKVNGEPGAWVMIYHSWHEGEVCTGYDRLLMVDYLYWKEDWPYMKGSSPS